MCDNEENIEFDWIIPENVSNNEYKKTNPGFFHFPFLIFLLFYQ